ncbi:hypothetical protein [Arthrobacter sp. SPG23]|uniref:hypothetical protein n=1 Tax=Arthrobacter sp. SPG23 TaxID=1610703 RepID=UPI000A6624EB|nr:hypothetical protein [Arthrobacter sp. SPG23]
MFTFAVLLLISLAFGALALIFVPVIRAREFDKKHIPTRNWVIAGILLATAVGLSLALPALNL